jgi:ABC-2 type transport system permease protein/oleandomycin transport system permease protein
MNTATNAVSDRGRLTLAETIADSRVMAARQLRKILRRPTYVVYLFVQPVISCCCSAMCSGARSTPGA